MPDCNSLLQFDTEAISSNYLNQYSALQFVNEQNYEQMKNNYSAIIPEYFEGGYDQFSLKRNSLSQLIAKAGITTIDKNYYRHTLSEVGAQAYANCIAEENGEILYAWVKDKTDKEITIIVRNGQKAYSTLEFYVGGRHKPRGKFPHVLHSGGEASLIFDYTDAESFTVTFNGTIKETQAQHGVTISLPRVIKLELRKEQRSLTAISQCYAGGYGDTSHNGTFDPAVFVADADFYILPATVKRIDAETINNGENGMGINQRQVDWNEVTENSHVVRLTSVISKIDGANRDTRGGRRETWTVQEERSFLVQMP